MELQYEKALQENDLSVSELSEDARSGIEGINDILKAISMLEKKGKNPTERTIKKLKAMDKWVYYEILDQLHDTDNNDDDAPVDTDEVVDEIKEQAKESSKNDEEKNAQNKLFTIIEKELEKLANSGKKEFTIEQIKSYAPNSYNAIYKAYQRGDDNGVKTRRYALIETRERIFTIKSI